jgi:lipase
MPTYQPFSFPRDGGALHGAVWGTSGPVLLCSHGITANHLAWAPLAEALGEGVRLVTIDHRGRGRSNGIRGPWSIDAHAADLMATLDHLGLPRADLMLGQSMGGFVVAVAAAKHRERCGPVLLIDGGLPLIDQVPKWLPAGLIIRLIIGPAMKRLDMRFASREAYHAFWRAHPAFARDWSDAAVAYVDYDLEGEPPQLRSSTSKESVLGDSRSMMGNRDIADALRALPGPVRFLRAERGVMDGKPLYTDRRVARWVKQIRGFSQFTVADVNHYTILLAPRGAQAVAMHARDMLQEIVIPA